MQQLVSDAVAAPAGVPLGAPPARWEFVAAAPVMQRVLTQARRVAHSKVPVLITGESGTGKELIASLIHFAGPRCAQPFVRVNCAALSESLVESELFGHEKGSFTGAEGSRAGRFELAHGGTLLLDEISEISVKLQAKLLRVLESEELERVGGARTLQIDVKVVATTNRDLEEEIAQGTFRADLFYRLNGVQIHLPPLRERREDIPPLALHFLERFRPETEKPQLGISGRTMELLRTYDWPGNIRQLRNAIHHACILADGSEIQPSDLPPLEAGSAPSAWRGRTLAEIEQQAILSTLREVDGNKTAAAHRLGITTRTLLNKLNKYRQEGVGYFVA